LDGSVTFTVQIKLQNGQLYYRRTTITITKYVMGAPCHHDMGPSRVADGAEGIQIWWVAANVKQAIADSRQVVVFQLGSWAVGNNSSL
jgi:hypothetical protein